MNQSSEFEGSVIQQHAYLYSTGFSMSPHTGSVAQHNVQVGSVHMHFNAKGLQKNHTSLKISNFFATLHKKLK
jgi:hypothetical protein